MAMTTCFFMTGIVAKYDVSRTPMGRLGQPHDLFCAPIFLASDDSDFITGQTLLADGESDALTSPARVIVWHSHG